MTDDKNERKRFLERSKHSQDRRLQHHEPKWQLSEQGEKSRQEWRAWRTKEQRHCNAMLMLRRMFKEIALILRLQDGNYRLSGDESRRVLKIPGWDESRVGRDLIKACMKRLDEDKPNA